MEIRAQAHAAWQNLGGNMILCGISSSWTASKCTKGAGAYLCCSPFSPSCNRHFRQEHSTLPKRRVYTVCCCYHPLLLDKGATTQMHVISRPQWHHEWKETRAFAWDPRRSILQHSSLGSHPSSLVIIRTPKQQVVSCCAASFATHSPAVCTQRPILQWQSRWCQNSRPRKLDHHSSQIHHFVSQYRSADN